MSDAQWFRSLYWRIAVGFVAFVALTLAAQAGLFFLLLSLRIERLPSGTAAEYSRVAAADLSSALARDRSLDIAAFVRRRHTSRTLPYSVIMRDGRTATVGMTELPPPGIVRMLRHRMDTETADQLREPMEPLRTGEPRPDLGPALSPIVIDGGVAGVVVVSPRRPFGAVIRELGPLMGAIGIALLVVGTTLVSLVVFGPAGRRLRALADAARRLGGGDLEARAPERGGDEVAGVARAFNQMAAQLSAREADVRAADRARRQLLADVSHELMTPLTAMRGYVETLTMPGLALDDATRERYLGVLEQETGRLERIVQDLLDLARLEGGGGALDLQDVPIESLFGRVLERHEQAARTKQVTMRASIAPGGEFAYGDPLRLEQALQNLAANALRHTPSGGTIDLEAQPASDGFVAVSVRDTGEGIPPEHLPSIFDRFYKVDASRGAGLGGSGLGLSIVKAIVERHGGTVRAESTPGEGTTMRVLLPTAPGEEARGIGPTG